MTSVGQREISNIPPEWVDEIPTRPSPFKAVVVSVATIMLLGLGWAFWSWGPKALEVFLDDNVPIAMHFEPGQMLQALGLCFKAFGIVGVLCAVAGLLSLTRIAATYYILRTSLIAVYLAVVAYVVVVWIGLFDILD
ncbi:MAG: hypothetical protein KJO79_07675, partial [Verrucomicrobiae bacterium]|nr:hypothetical protein [Verrucomicrobiae bacterium]NNJ87043.1 hypothetical protein [Akkermansiaceae bacterium]